jgi:hypothetical protein
MGIDIHGLNFLRYASKKQQLERVATIGRQALAISPFWLARVMGTAVSAESNLFCEDFLIKHLGASIVESFDFSAYEGATHVVDMNMPIHAPREYNTVIDFGCIEHIFNAPQALKNISVLCAAGGQIIHVLPANNFCGHGFWQFSPEVFFSLYSHENGYRDTEVFLADLKKCDRWFEVIKPSGGRRAQVTSSRPLYVMCRTRKSGLVSHDSVQQSDYLVAWDNASMDEKLPAGTYGAIKQIISKSPLLRVFLVSLYRSFRKTADGLRNPTTLSNRNPHLKKRDVLRLLEN